MVHTDTGIVMIPSAEIGDWLVLVNVAERLSEVSGGILAAAEEGEPYETLVRQLRVLHLQHTEVAELADRAKQCQIEYQRKASETAQKSGRTVAIPSTAVGVA